MLTNVALSWHFSLAAIALLPSGAGARLVGGGVEPAGGGVEALPQTSNILFRAKDSIKNRRNAAQ